MSNLTRAEMETIIRAAADEDHWTIYTEDRKMITKLENAGWSSYTKGYYRIPRRAITIRKMDSVLNPKPRGGSGNFGKGEGNE